MKAVEDTIMIIPQKWVQVCSAVGHCKNHPIKFVLVNENEASSVLDTVETVQSTDTVKEIVEIPIVAVKKEKVITSFDTIQPCDVSLLETQAYYTPNTNLVRTSQEMESPMNYDILANSIVFTFAILLTAKYAVSCLPAWRSLFSELKQVV
jgi:hypothetical protein